MAKIATPVYHTKCSGVPLEVSKDESVFKSLVLDVGLMNHIHKVSWQSLKNFSEKGTVNRGANR